MVISLKDEFYPRKPLGELLHLLKNSYEAEAGSGRAIFVTPKIYYEEAQLIAGWLRDQKTGDIVSLKAPVGSPNNRKSYTVLIGNVELFESALSALPPYVVPPAESHIEGMDASLRNALQPLKISYDPDRIENADFMLTSGTAEDMRWALQAIRAFQTDTAQDGIRIEVAESQCVARIYMPSPALRQILDEERHNERKQKWAQEYGPQIERWLSQMSVRSLGMSANFSIRSADAESMYALTTLIANQLDPWTETSFERDGPHCLQIRNPDFQLREILLNAKKRTLAAASAIQ